MEKLTKQDIKGPDQFIKTARSVTHYVEDHAKTIGFAFVAFLVLGAAYAGWDVYTGYREGKAKVALFEAKKAHEDKVSAAEKEWASKQKDSKKKTEPPKAAFDESIVAGYQGVTEKYKSTVAAAVSASRLGEYFQEYQKTDEAKKVLTQYKDFTTSPLVQSVILLQLARLEAESGACETADTFWNKILNNQALKVWHAEALMKRGACYYQTQKLDKAKEAFQRVTSEFEDSPAAQSAKAYMRILGT